MQFPETDVAGLLARIPDRDRGRLVRLGAVQDFHKGDSIFNAGELSHHVYLLLKGRVKIYQPSTVGTTRQTVTTTLGQLDREGLISIDQHKIHITGRELLAQVGHPQAVATHV